jgi:hypothetical protein
MTASLCFAVAAIALAAEMVVLAWYGVRILAISENTALAGTVAAIAITCYAIPVFYTVDVRVVLMHAPALMFAVAVAATSYLVALNFNWGLSICGRIAFQVAAFVRREAVHLLIIIHDLVVVAVEAVTHRDKHAHA